MRFIALLFTAAFLFSGCGGAPQPTEAERKQQEERVAKEENEQRIRGVQNEVRLRAMESARSIRERAYCAPSPESLGSLYGLLANGDSERAGAVADLTGAVVVEPKTRILVLKLRPFYKGIGANLVRVARTGRACYVSNAALRN
jgi:hypothetical protein